MGLIVQDNDRDAQAVGEWLLPAPLSQHRGLGSPDLRPHPPPDPHSASSVPLP